MANITDQFVTSFSELYIGDKRTIGDVDYTDQANVRSFFVGGPTASRTRQLMLRSLMMLVYLL